MSARTTRFVGLYAILAMVAMVIAAPLLALSYFGTSEGAEELESGTVSSWAEPTGDRLDALLTWASPDRVYSTYLQIFSISFPAVLLCAVAIRRTRLAVKPSERRAWRLTLIGYGLATAGILTAGVILIGGNPTGTALNVAFLALMVPGMLLSAVGSTWLGIALLRSPDRFTPRATAWLLALAFPAMVIVPVVLGHNSLGMLGMVTAWGIAGVGLWRGDVRESVTVGVQNV